ncbi:MAG: methionyl-tRNA formyltransferase [Bifidobacteriaceae bacterium]|nr:methionyl-tRNA formyltransferase [Bifidobacteriaceae bacterium]
MRILFAGTPDVAVTSLRLLAASHEQQGSDLEVVGVLTRPDAPQGRGRKLAPSPVKVAAQELGIPVLDKNPRDEGFLDDLAAFHADAAAVVAYGNILSTQVLDAMPQGWYNLHFSLLPQWRGAAPVQRAIWSGDTLTGVTVFRITEGMDEGPILAQSTTEIGEHETSGELFARLAEDGGHLLCSAMELVAQGRAMLVPQQQGAFEVAAKIRTDDARIRFDVPVFAADRQIRACTPEPGAWCVVHADGTADDAVKLHVDEARPVGDASALPADAAARIAAGKPGAIVADKKHVWVCTRTQPLELLRVKPQGKRSMPAADWARGAHLSAEAYCD